MKAKITWKNKEKEEEINDQCDGTSVYSLWCFLYCTILLRKFISMLYSYMCGNKFSVIPKCRRIKQIDTYHLNDGQSVTEFKRYVCISSHFVDFFFLFLLCFFFLTAQNHNIHHLWPLYIELKYHSIVHPSVYRRNKYMRQMYSRKRDCECEIERDWMNFNMTLKRKIF